MGKRFKQNPLKLNTASHHNTSCYADTDGFLEHLQSGGSLHYKGPALQKIIPGFFGSPGIIQGGSIWYVCTLGSAFSVTLKLLEQTKEWIHLKNPYLSKPKDHTNKDDMTGTVALENSG